MKRAIALLVVFILIGFASVVMAGQTARMNTGCGLGSMIFQDNKQVDDSLLLQVLMATTNSTFGNQTFGITSGTSNCKKPSKIVKDERMKEFVVANLDELAKDIARGSGETLQSLLDMMHIPVADRTEVSKKLQRNFVNIFPAEDVEATEVLDNIVKVING